MNVHILFVVWLFWRASHSSNARGNATGQFRNYRFRAVDVPKVPLQIPRYSGKRNEVGKSRYHFGVELYPGGGVKRNGTAHGAQDRREAVCPSLGPIVL